MLSVKNLSKSFNEPVLKGANFVANPAELTVIEGQNGAGKSTLFNVLTGFLSADEGQIILAEKDITKLSEFERAKFMAILVQDVKTAVVPSLTVLENGVLAVIKNRPASFFKSATNAYNKDLVVAHLQALDIAYEGFLLRPMAELSGGQRQILAFAFATLNRPQIILLDEPTAALDDDSSKRLLQLVKRFIQKWRIPALMISHNKDLNQQFGDALWRLSNGILHPSKTINGEQ